MPGPFVLSWSPARTRGRSARAASAFGGSAASLNRPIAFDGGYHSSRLGARNVRLGSDSDVAAFLIDVRFSNRPFGVKRFQTIHHHSVDVARGLVLLFGIGTRALPSWDSKTGWNNLYRGLAIRRATGPSGHTNSPHPSSREGHLSTAWWNSSFLLSHLVTCVPHATAASRVHRNSVPSTQMRCMITANRRASATIAFFIPAVPGDLRAAFRGVGVSTLIAGTVGPAVATEEPVERLAAGAATCRFKRGMYARPYGEVTLSGGRMGFKTAIIDGFRNEGTQSRMQPARLFEQNSAIF